MRWAWTLVLAVTLAASWQGLAAGQGAAPGAAAGSGGAGSRMGGGAGANAASQALEQSGASRETLRAYGADVPSSAPEAGGAVRPGAPAVAGPETVTGTVGEGRAIVDHTASAARLEDLQRAPAMPQIFIQQWVYRDRELPLVDTSRDATEVVPLTLAEAVHAALEHNPGVAAQRLAPLRVLEDVRLAEAAFDPKFLATLNKDYRKAPNSSGLAAVLENVTKNRNWNLAVTKLLRTGADFRIDFTNNRFVSNARFQGLRPQYRPELVFSLNQPLLRNFGSNFAYLLVNVTAINSESAQYTYRADLANFVRLVVGAYWNVIFARQNLVVRQQSLALARQTLHENSERVRVGLLAPVSVKEAESQAAAREAEVIVAENALDEAELTLRRTVYLQSGDSIIPKRVDPIEQPRTAPVRVDAEQALATALEQRPELIAQNLELRGRNLTARIQGNQLLPRLDFVGNFGLNGLSGDAVPVEVDGETVVTPFTGSYGKALDRLSSTDFYSFQAGVELEVPIGNAAAKAQYAQARIDVASAELNRRQLLSDITLEVQRAVNDVNTNIKRIQSTRLARELAEENLRDQQKRLDVGMATTKDILDFQDQLTTARGNEVQAATDYNVSLAELARAQGTLLDEYSVVVEVPGERFTPWWARF